MSPTVVRSSRCRSPIASTRALTDESEPKLRTAGGDRVIKPYQLVDTVARSNSGEITMEQIRVVESGDVLVAIGRPGQLTELSALCGVETRP